MATQYGKAIPFSKPEVDNMHAESVGKTGSMLFLSWLNLWQDSSVTTTITQSLQQMEKEIFFS